MKTTPSPHTSRENPLINLLINIVIPVVILSKFTGPEYLGFTYGFIAALSLPFLYGCYDLVKRKKINFFSLLGLLNILFTGGIGLLELDKFWMVVKETAIPLVMGIVVLASQKTRWPLVKTFLNQVLDFEKIEQGLRQKGLEEKWEKKLWLSNILLGGTFFISALLNYILAEIILQGEPGSQEFAKSVADMLKYSFPVITIPMSIMVGFIFYFLFGSLKRDTDLDLENLMRRP